MRERSLDALIAGVAARQQGAFTWGQARRLGATAGVREVRVEQGRWVRVHRAAGPAPYAPRMRILVTGGAGFIGSHLSEALLERGDQVVVLDNLSTGSRDNLQGASKHDGFEFVSGSVLDAVLLDDLTAECDQVVHLAAAVGVQLIVSEPLRSLRTNVLGAVNVFEAAHRYRRPVLVASTSEIYGKNSGLLHERSDRVLGPPSVARWAYSTSKAVDEILSFAYWRERHVPTVVARFFNTVGPRQTGAYGMVVPRLVAQALLGRPLTVYGDGSQTRCFCHVSDVVRAVVGLLDRPEAAGEPYNVGSNEEVSILELAHRIAARTGSASSIEFVPYEEVYGDQYEDMLRRAPDTTKLRNLLGWEPSHDLDSIIDATVDWAHTVGPERLLQA
ncbi:MAG TPA: GDP-mannose 4,6-dehydratase [Actinomycetota bacterium]|nr:GDP-mannose 4,6-dehydratase [Actinomycetota bacterium]